jgi:hypothetical protein
MVKPTAVSSSWLVYRNTLPSYTMGAGSAVYLVCMMGLSAWSGLVGTIVATISIDAEIRNLLLIDQSSKWPVVCGHAE